MNDLFHISQQEIDSAEWDTARAMCHHYGYDIREIAARLAKFRAERRAAHQQAVDALNVKTFPVPLPDAPAKLVHFNAVKQYWDYRKQRWTQSGIIYIGRAWPYQRLPESLFANPFRIEKDTDELREDAIELYASWLLNPKQARILRQIDMLRGMTMVCWCRPRRCHGDVLLKLLQDKPSYADIPLT